MLYIISFIFFQIIQSSNLLFIVGSFDRALAKNGSFGFLSVGLCVVKNQMCHLWVGCLFTLTHNINFSIFSLNTQFIFIYRIFLSFNYLIFFVKHMIFIVFCKFYITNSCSLHTKNNCGNS